MSDTLYSNAHHERSIKLSSPRREAIVGRWPIRFTRGQELVDRALWTMYQESVQDAQSASQPVPNQLGANVLSLESRLARPDSVPVVEPQAAEMATGPSEVAYLSAMRQAVNDSYRQQGIVDDQKAA